MHDAHYIITSDGNFVSENELYHYGVLGMKWGVRRGRTGQVYEKAQRKLAKIDRKVDKYTRKKYKYANPLIRTDISDGLYKRAMRKSDKATSKAIEWAKKASKVLGSEKVGEFKNSEGVAIGERYLNMIKDRKL